MIDNWSDFVAEVGSLPAGAVDAVVAPLSDARLRLWGTDANGGLSATWKMGPDPNADWTDSPCGLAANFDAQLDEERVIFPARARTHGHTTIARPCL